MPSPNACARRFRARCSCSTRKEPTVGESYKELAIAIRLEERAGRWDGAPPALCDKAAAAIRAVVRERDEAQRSLQEAVGHRMDGEVFAATLRCAYDTLRARERDCLSVESQIAAVTAERDLANTLIEKQAHDLHGEGMQLAAEREKVARMATVLEMVSRCGKCTRCQAVASSFAFALASPDEAAKGDSKGGHCWDTKHGCCWRGRLECVCSCGKCIIARAKPIIAAIDEAAK